MRIALLAVLAFAGLWFVALRPKTADTTAAPVAPVAQPAKPAKGLTGAPDKAKDAVAKANGASAKAEATAKATGEPAKAPAAAKAPVAPKAPAAAKPAVAKADPTPAPPKAAKPAPTAVPAGQAATPGAGTAKSRDETAKVKRVLADLEAKKVVVLLFWDRRSADDREVYRAVEQSDRHDGKVSVRAAPIQKLGDYDSVTKGLPIAASPSVVVIDEQKRATVITGLTVTSEVNAAVNRALKRK
jgi:hypothetical protein